MSYFRRGVGDFDFTAKEKAFPIFNQTARVDCTHYLETATQKYWLFLLTHNDQAGLLIVTPPTNIEVLPLNPDREQIILKDAYTFKYISLAGVQQGKFMCGNAVDLFIGDVTNKIHRISIADLITSHTSANELVQGYIHTNNALMPTPTDFNIDNITGAIATDKHILLLNNLLKTLDSYKVSDYTSDNDFPPLSLTNIGGDERSNYRGLAFYDSKVFIGATRNIQSPTPRIYQADIRETDVNGNALPSFPGLVKRNAHQIAQGGTTVTEMVRAEVSRIMGPNTIDKIIDLGWEGNLVYVLGSLNGVTVKTCFALDVSNINNITRGTDIVINQTDCPGDPVAMDFKFNKIHLILKEGTDHFYCKVDITPQQPITPPLTTYTTTVARYRRVVSTDPEHIIDLPTDISSSTAIAGYRNIISRFNDGGGSLGAMTFDIYASAAHPEHLPLESQASRDTRQRGSHVLFNALTGSCTTPRVLIIEDSNNDTVLATLSPYYDSGSSGLVIPDSSYCGNTLPGGDWNLSNPWRRIRVIIFINPTTNNVEHWIYDPAIVVGQTLEL